MGKTVKKSLAMVMTVTMFTAIVPQTTFANDYTAHWANVVITKWKDKGLLKGYEDGTFRPNQPITRAEFATLLVRMFGYGIEEDIMPFQDIKEGSWYYKAVQAIADEKIIYEEDNLFEPNKPITRQEAIYALNQAYNIQQVGEDLPFKDKDDILTWAQNAIESMYSQGYIQGTADGMLYPQKPLTRAEFLTMVENMTHTIINQSGTYAEDVKGNLIINIKDVHLKDMIIEGDLYLAEGIAEGDVSLENVQVRGNVFVKGGGVNSIVSKQCQYEGKIIVAAKKPVRVVIEGEGVEVQILPSVQAILKGTFNTVELGENASLTLEQAKIKKVVTKNSDENQEAPISQLHIDKSSQVTEMDAYAPVTIKNNGKVQSLNVYTEGVVIDKSPNVVNIKSADITVNIAGKDKNQELLDKEKDKEDNNKEEDSDSTPEKVEKVIIEDIQLSKQIAYTGDDINIQLKMKVDPSVEKIGVHLDLGYSAVFETLQYNLQTGLYEGNLHIHKAEDIGIKTLEFYYYTKGGHWAENYQKVKLSSKLEKKAQIDIRKYFALEKLQVHQNEVNVGDRLSAEAKFSTREEHPIDIQGGSFRFSRIDEHERVYESIYILAKYNKDTGMLEGEESITPKIYQGDYILEQIHVYGEDENGNSIGESFYDNKDFEGIQVKVNNEITDLDAPILQSIYFNQTQYVIGDVLNIQANIDDESQVERVELEFEIKNEHSRKHYSNVILQQDTSGQWYTEQEINGYEEGTWYITAIYLEDEWGNHTYISSEDLETLQLPAIQVEGLVDIEEVAFSQQEVKPGDTLGIEFTIQENFKDTYDIEDVRVDLSREIDEKVLERLSFRAQYDDETNTYKGELEIPKSLQGGAYTIDYIRVNLEHKDKDTFVQDIEYAEEIKQGATSIKVNNYIEDLNAPIFKGIKFEKETYKVGEELIIQVDAEDESEITEGRISFSITKSNGSDNYCSIPIKYNEETGTYEARTTIEGEYKGIWHLTQIRLEDEWENYTYIREKDLEVLQLPTIQVEGLVDIEEVDFSQQEVKPGDTLGIELVIQEKFKEAYEIENIGVSLSRETGEKVSEWLYFRTRYDDETNTYKGEVEIPKTLQGGAYFVNSINVEADHKEKDQRIWDIYYKEDLELDTPIIQVNHEILDLDAPIFKGIKFEKEIYNLREELIIQVEAEDESEITQGYLDFFITKEDGSKEYRLIYVGYNEEIGAYEARKTLYEGDEGIWKLTGIRLEDEWGNYIKLTVEELENLQIPTIQVEGLVDIESPIQE